MPQFPRSVHILRGIILAAGWLLLGTGCHDEVAPTPLLLAAEPAFGGPGVNLGHGRTSGGILFGSPSGPTGGPSGGIFGGGISGGGIPGGGISGGGISGGGISGGGISGGVSAGGGCSTGRCPTGAPPAGAGLAPKSIPGSTPLPPFGAKSKGSPANTPPAAEGVANALTGAGAAAALTAQIAGSLVSGVSPAAVALSAAASTIGTVVNEAVAREAKAKNGAESQPSESIPQLDPNCLNGDCSLGQRHSLDAEKPEK